MSKLNQLFQKQDHSFTFNADRKTLVGAGLYLLFFCAFEFFYIQVDFSDFSNFLNQEQSFFYSLVFIFYISISLYLFFIFVVITLSSKWQYKIVYLAIFSLAMFAEYGYQKALGRFTNFYDVIAALSATNEQKFDSLFAYTNSLALIPCFALLIFCLALRQSKTQFGGKILVVLMTLNGLFFFHLPYVNQLFFGRKFVSISFATFCQTIADYALNEPIAQLNPTKREAVEIPAAERNYHPANNIIFVFDESIRGDHLSLNGYARPTTPYLEKLAARKLLVNWGISVSASTSSHPSYDAMISGATPDMLGNLSLQEVNSLPTLFQYAKAMNYRTHLFDGQMKRYWGGNSEDVNYIDNFVSLSEIDSPKRIEDWEIGNKITNADNRDNQLKQWEIDTKIAKSVNSIFSNSTGNFIFIYKRGSHFPYEKNYPAEETFWKPVYFFKEQYEIPTADKYDAIVNSYDNSIRYNLDNFFKTLAPDYSNLPNNTVIFYTSDHGESFYVDGKAGHGGTTREEATVPLFLLGNTGKNIDTDFKASHCNVFTTLLDTMDYPVELRKYPYSISLFRAKKTNSEKRFYNPHQEKIAFD